MGFGNRFGLSCGCCGGVAGSFCGCNSVPHDLILTITGATGPVAPGTYPMSFGPLPSALPPVGGVGLATGWWSGPVTAHFASGDRTVYMTLFCDPPFIDLYSWFDFGDGTSRSVRLARWSGSFGAGFASCSPFFLHNGGSVLGSQVFNLDPA